MSQTNAHAHESAPAKQQRPAAILFVTAFAAFLATFNETFLNVGFAPIMEALTVDVSTVQWLATAYMLGAAVMVPVSAFAYRSFPTRPLFCMTTALLVIGSIIGALAPNFTVLLIGRIVQALGTGMLIPIGMNITLEMAPREKLGTYMGIMGAMTTLGPSSSVILAGLILAAAPWNMLLWVFGGLSLLCLLAGAIILRDIAKLTHPRLDAASVALIGIALIGILYGVSTIFVGNIAIALGAAVVGIIALVFFVRRQGKLTEPLIDLRPLKIPPFAVGVVVNMLSLVTIFAMNIIVPTYMQSVLGTPPLIASLTLFPAILCSCVASPIAGRIYDKHGPGILLPAGFACITVFSVLTAVFISTASPVVLALIYIPVICGSALIIGPVQSFALSKLPPELNPHGVTVMSTGFQIAGCFGSSVFTGVYALVGASAAASGLAAAQAATEGMLAAGVLVGIFAFVGFFLALWIRRVAARPIVDAAPAWNEAGEATAAAPVDTLAAIMKTDVYTVLPHTSVAEAMKLFASKGISGAPVVDEERRVVGFISDGDIMSAIADQVPAFKTAWSFVVERDKADFDATLRRTMAQPVSDIANKRVIAVNIEDDLGEVARVLAEGHLKKAPVLEGDRMVGIINRSNITSYALERFGV
ncbi:MFS transporter [Anaerotardibacter muris]|uniref:MFS transporter n=1 Tax=Anaerotardibacter muris TaxID=2941505 RepID=UPI002040DCB9|nr:MFS transporter [Anaerotardibacter muris]